MTLRMGLRSFLALAAIFAASGASALGVSIVGDYSIANGSSPQLSSPTAIYGWGGGALINFGSGKVGFELGGIYSARGYNQSPTQVNGNMLRIPAMITLTESVLYLGAGGFYAFNVGTATQNGAAITSGLATSDYGLEGAAGFHIPFGHVLKLVIEGRYVYGLSNQATTGGQTLNWRNMEALVGFHFGA